MNPEDAPPALETAATPRSRSRHAAPTGRDRPLPRLIWYRFVQQISMGLFLIAGGVRATGRRNVPASGGALLVSNHLSFWDVFALGLLLPRPLNYVARSSLFKPGLAFMIRSIGGFPILREGFGPQGFKETLKRLKVGGIVTFFPEGTRSRTGALGPLKPGIATLATRAKVPIIPAGLAGTFEAWPRHRRFPRPYPIRVHYGPPIPPSAFDGLEPEAATALVRDRIQLAVAAARAGLARDLGHWS